MYCVNLITKMYGTIYCEGGASFSPLFGSLAVKDISLEINKHGIYGLLGRMERKVDHDEYYVWGFETDRG